METRFIRFAVVVLVVVLSSVCFSYSGGTGTGVSGDPYQISTSADWQELVNTPADWGKEFILTADIDLAGLSLTPVGNTSTAFTGVFDGDNHVIRNAVINTPGSDYVGLFGFVGSGSLVKNLGVENVNITGMDRVGGLLGYNYGTVQSCYSTGSVSGRDRIGGLMGGSYQGPVQSCYSTSTVSGRDLVGGLMGGNWYGPVQYCYATGLVSGNRYVGGLVGYNGNDWTGTVQYCYATGSVSGSDRFVGGLCGYNYYGTISQSYATGAVSGGDRYVGGLCGMNEYGTITSCYATGAVSGGKYVGGLCGGSSGGTITSCYATGAVTGTKEYVGGLCGQSNGTITSCFWDIETSGQSGSSGGKGLTTVQMKTMSIYQNAGWADKGWVIQDGIDYPRLAWENTSGSPIPPAQAVPLVGSGTETEPYQIWTADEFALLSWYASVLDKHISLMADLDLSGVEIYPIGDIGFFTGVFESNGHVIRNAVIDTPGSDYVGLFGYVGGGGQIKNLGVENVNLTGRYYVGGLCGYNKGTITSCYATGAVTGTGSYVGGLCGWNASGNITSCYATGEGYRNRACRRAVRG